MNIDFTDTLSLPSGPVTVTVSAMSNACDVTVGDGDSLRVAWDHVDNMDLLSELFEYEMLIVFKAIVVLLGMAHRSRDLLG